MKQFLTFLVICCSLSFSPARAEAPRAEVTLDSLHKQLITIVEAEIASNKELEEAYASRLKSMMPVWRDTPSRASIQSRLQQLSGYLNQSHVSQKTKDAAGGCITQIGEFLEKQSKQMAEDISKTTGDLLRRVMKTSDPEEIRKLISEYKEYRSKTAHGGFRDESASPPDTSSASQFMDYWLSFHNYRVAEQMRYAAGQITQMESLSVRVSSFLNSDEITQAMQNLRKSIGMLPPQELAVLWQQTLEEILNDTNQDRLDELMQKVNKHYQIAQASASSEMQASRWQWLDNLGHKLQECVQRGREGGIPNFSVEEFTRSDSSYGTLIKPAELASRLNKYQIRRKDDQGNVISLRLFYDSTELKSATEQLLARVLDDTNQNQLADIQNEIKRLRSYASAYRYASASNVSNQLDRLSQLTRSISDNVAMLKSGGNNQLNLSQLYQEYSDGVVLLSKDQLLEKLKRYHVLVQAKDGSPTKRALYVSAEALIQEIKSYAELPALLPEITRASTSASSESGAQLVAALMPRIARCAEIAQYLSSGEAFVISTQASSPHYYYGDSSRSMPASGPAVDKITQLEAEAEWMVVRRFFPKEDSPNSEDHEARMKSLMARLREQKNYEAMIRLHAVSQYFKPARQLLSPAQSQAMRDYVNGVRQQEVFEQPRLAVYYLQKAAASPATAVDGDLLKIRLQSLRQKFPADYEKGIEDALKTPAAESVPREIEVPAASR